MQVQSNLIVFAILIRLCLTAILFRGAQPRPSVSLLQPTAKRKVKRKISCANNVDNRTTVGMVEADPPGQGGWACATGSRVKKPTDAQA